MTVAKFHSLGSCPSPRLVLKRLHGDCVITGAISLSIKFLISPPSDLRFEQSLKIVEDFVLGVGELELSSLSITPLRPAQHTSANGSLLVEMYESRKMQVGKGERTRKEQQEHKITSTLARKRHV